MTPKVQSWLAELVLPTVRKVAAYSGSYEIEACRIVSSNNNKQQSVEKTVKSNVKSIIKLVRKLIDRLPESAASCPSVLRHGMALMRHQLSLKYTEIDDLQIASSLFFLRFLCTALLNHSPYPELTKSTY